MSQDRRRVTEEIGEFNAHLLTMGRSVEERLRSVVRALVDRNHESLADLIHGDTGIDDLRITIDAQCFTLLALYQPVATDLRTIVSTLKINGELERVADLASHIAKAAQRYLRHSPVKPLVDLPRMSELALKMLGGSLDAFVSKDVGPAQAVLRQDGWLVALKDQILRELLTFMLGNPLTIEPSIDLILVSRFLEGVAAHAKSIAEDVIFIVEARDIRHRSTNLLTATGLALAGTIVERRKRPGVEPV